MRGQGLRCRQRQGRGAVARRQLGRAREELGALRQVSSEFGVARGVMERVVVEAQGMAEEAVGRAAGMG